MTGGAGARGGLERGFRPRRTPARDSGGPEPARPSLLAASIRPEGLTTETADPPRLHTAPLKDREPLLGKVLRKEGDSRPRTDHPFVVLPALTRPSRRPSFCL